MSGVAAYAGVVLYTLPGLVVGLLLHELAHAAMALRCGDPTPRRAQRMSLDPRRQIDAVGFAAVLVTGFGWARPVALDPIHLRGRARRAAVVAAGPLAHVAVAAVFALALRVEEITSGIDINGFVTTAQSSAQAILLGVLLQGFFINVALAIFNLLPLPGLDGYALLRSLVFPRAARVFLWMEAQRYAVYVVAVAAVVLPAELTHGAVNPLGAATVGLAGTVYSHVVHSGAVPIFLGLPNLFLVFR